MTFYATDNDLPEVRDYNMKGRTYRYFEGNALFPFGHGLSYTTFALGEPAYKNNAVSVEVANTGNVDGETVVQVYVEDPRDVNGPKKTLRGFQRVALKAGEKKMLTIAFPRENFERWDESTNTMRVVEGEQMLMVGFSSADESQKKIVVKVK